MLKGCVMFAFGLKVSTGCSREGPHRYNRKWGFDIRKYCYDLGKYPPQIGT